MNEANVPAAAAAIKICPSVLASDFTRLGDEITRLESSGADMVHLDVMDGAFVPNITIGPQIIAQLRARTKLPFDVHLMINDPDKHIDSFAAAGADVITVHYEACPHLFRTIQLIRSYGLSPGVALNPHTPATLLRWVIREVDVVLVMTVNPGFGGQRFLSAMLGKIAEVRAMARDVGAEACIEVDGGIDASNADDVARAGANVIVAGTAVFKAPDMSAAIRKIREAAEFGSRKVYGAAVCGGEYKKADSK